MFDSSVVALTVPDDEVHQSLWSYDQISEGGFDNTLAADTLQKMSELILMIAPRQWVLSMVV